MKRHTHIESDRGGTSRVIQTWRYANTSFRADIKIDKIYPWQGHATLSIWGVGGWNELVRMTGAEVNDLALESGAEVSEHPDDVILALEAEARDLLGWPVKESAG